MNLRPDRNYLATATTKGTAEPTYDADQIQTAYDTVTQGHDAWLHWFQANEITPLSVAYEDIAQAPQFHLHKILEFIGVDPACATGVTPGTAQLANARNQAWSTRFRADAGLAPNALPT